MSKIKAVTVYQIPGSDKLYKSEDLAAKAMKAAKQREAREKRKREREEEERRVREEQRNYVRLNAVSPSHALQLVAEKAKEYWGLEVVVVRGASRKRIVVKNGEEFINLESVEISLSDPSGNGLKKLGVVRGGFSISIEEILFRSGFSGFYAEGGFRGRCGEYNMEMYLSLRMDEFPLIKEKYEEWKRQKERESEYMKRMQRLGLAAGLLAAQDPSCIRADELLKYYEDCLDIARTRRDNIYSSYRRGLQKLFEVSEPPVKVDKELEEQFGE